MKTLRIAPVATAALVVLLLVPACGDDFGHVGASKRIAVTITGGDRGDPSRRLPLSVKNPTSFTLHLEAQLPDGSTDAAFDGRFARVSVKPGTVADLGTRNVELKAGQADVTVPVIATFGDANFWVEDLGYEPASPTRDPPPQCSDGVDNNGNGLIDFPADPGCYSPVDDSEDGGTYATGVSDTLYFSRPRIADVRGYAPAEGKNGNATSFPHEQVDIDTGWREGGDFAFSTVVIRISADGLYAQDIQNDLGSAPPGYGGIFAYTYSTPPLVRVCDRLKLLSGQSSDFYGFTELGFPTWLIEPWDPTQRPCMVPEPTVLGTHDAADPNRLWQLESTLVRVQTAGTISVHVAGHLGPGLVKKDATGAYVPTADNSNCDFNHNGKVDYTDMAGEAACAAACNGTTMAPPTDMECSEWSAFAAQSDFELLLTDAAAAGAPPVRIQGNAASAAQFSPTVSRGQTISSFTGTVRYFSGGTQFTVEARCDDDIVAQVGQPPMTSDRACVHPRNVLDQNNGNPQ
jgi:hypothetical protein